MNIKKVILYSRAIFNYLIARFCVFFSPIQKNKFFCISMLGNNYGDNIKCLSDYIKENHPNPQIVWAFSDVLYKKIKCREKKVSLYTFSYYYHIWSAKYILNNATLSPLFYRKRKGQICLETWHGTALKKIGFDIQERKNFEKMQRILNFNPVQYNADLTDIIVSGSRFMSDIYREKFGYKNQIYEVGTPRNDIFFSKKSEIISKVRELYNIDPDMGVILYAPTFRVDASFKYYDIDLQKVKRCFENKYGKNFVVMIRIHPNLLKKDGMFKSMFSKDAIDVSLYPNMQDLLYVSDVLVTDYSSSMFDFMYLYRPVIMYVPDRKTYNRGFYWNLEDLPFLIVNNNSEIEDVVNNYDEECYKKTINIFLKKIGSAEIGNATEQTYNILVSWKKC